MVTALAKELLLSSWWKQNKNNKMHYLLQLTNTASETNFNIVNRPR